VVIQVVVVAEVVVVVVAAAAAAEVAAVLQAFAVMAYLKRSNHNMGCPCHHQPHSVSPPECRIMAYLQQIRLILIFPLSVCLKLHLI
jgi:hypothetical protein